MDDASLPLKWHQKTLEHKYRVVIDQEPTRLVIYGARSGVSDATQELYRVRMSLHTPTSSHSKLFIGRHSASTRITTLLTTSLCRLGPHIVLVSGQLVNDFRKRRTQRLLWM